MALAILGQRSERAARRRDIRAAAQRGDAEGLSMEAFYDDLADNCSAVEVMGEEKLRVIATELVNALVRRAGSVPEDQAGGAS